MCTIFTIFNLNKWLESKIHCQSFNINIWKNEFWKNEFWKNWFHFVFCLQQTNLHHQPFDQNFQHIVSMLILVILAIVKKFFLTTFCGFWSKTLPYKINDDWFHKISKLKNTSHLFNLFLLCFFYCRLWFCKKIDNLR